MQEAVLTHWIEVALALRGQPRTYAERMRTQAMAAGYVAQAYKVEELVAVEAVAPLFAQYVPHV